MSAAPIVIKIGGRTLSSPGVVEHLVSDISSRSDRRIVLVHGGGAAVTSLAGRLGISSEFADGVRMTGKEEMEVVDMVLAGLLNKRIARRFQAAGVPAVGLCASDGGLLTGAPVTRPDGSPSRTGRVVARAPAVLEHLLEAGYLTVLASTFMDEAGTGLNLNADDAAFEIATMLRARALLFLSDVPGILRGAGATEAPIPVLTPPEVEQEIAAGVIGGGMIPKVRSSVGALHAGVGIVIIGAYTEASSLDELMSGRSGTRIEA